MKNKTKSQITMLMIIGLVLFIAVSLILYLSKSVVKKQSQQSAKKVQEAAIDVHPIREFVAKCVDKLAKDAVLLIGKQGGYLYKSQGGTLIDFSPEQEGIFFVNYNNNRVAYDIYPPKFDLPPYSSKVPLYPWKEFPYRPPDFITEVPRGYFGINNMPPLTSDEGSHSIQRQIESYIDSNMVECADFDFFENQGYKIQTGKPKTDVVIATRDVSINSNIPIKITNLATNEFTELKDFSTRVDARLRTIYSFTRILVEEDISQITFDIDEQDNDFDQISVKLVKDIVPYDDLVVITDDKSKLYGKSFEYIFARKNRAPALHYIPTEIAEFPDGCIVRFDDIINNPLEAKDPDEDNIDFSVEPLHFFPYTVSAPEAAFTIKASDDTLFDFHTITTKRDDSAICPT